MKLSELEKQAELRPAPEPEMPIRWSLITAIAAGVLLAIYLADFLRGAP
jgi:hypothetical protein